MFKFVMIIVFIIALIFSSFFAIVDFGPQNMIPIIVYNRIGEEVDTGDIQFTHARRFKEQMKMLRDSSYNVIGLDEIVRMYKRKQKIPRKTVAITFNDGYAEVANVAVPILTKYRLPATVFVTSSKIGKGGYIDEAQLQSISQSSYIKIGARGVHDKSFQGMQSSEITLEIFNSRAALQKITSTDVNFFAYPDGYYNKLIKSKVRESGYAGAVTMIPPGRHPDKDRYAMQRNWISSKDNYWSFRLKLWGNYPYVKKFLDKIKIKKFWK